MITMDEFPIIQTKRLILRGFTFFDAKEVQKLAGAWEVSNACLYIPHPYEDGLAETWISCHQQWLKEEEQAIFAIASSNDGHLIGAAGLSDIDQEHSRGELGYWIGKPYWGKGYATEAARAIADFGFRDLGLNRIIANHFTRNPASGRVLEKIGMKKEGLLRQHVYKSGVFEDLITYGLLREDWPGIIQNPILSKRNQ